MSEQHLLITGGTGFIGQALCPALISRGYRLTVLSRQQAEKVKAACGPVTAIRSLSEIRKSEGFSGVINLAGEGIADKRWTAQRKRQLRDSRIALTQQLVATLLGCERLPEVVISGSAVGYYGDQGQRTVTESTPPTDDFPHRLCRDWEQAIQPICDQGVRLCLSRTGLVAGKDGGFLKKMVLPFRFGVGGRLGSGEQYMPWVHRDDVVAGLIWMLENPDARGPYNLVSPDPVTNREFTRTLAKVLNRPAVLPVPAALLKVAMGEMAGLLLGGQKAKPDRLLEEGYTFLWPELKSSLRQALRRTPS